MRFVIRARVYKDGAPCPALAEVWDVAPEELSDNGRATLEIIAGIAPSALRSAVSWSSQAFLEFQDLQSIPIPSQGRFFNLSYLFCEALSALREAVVCGLNGQTHSSLGTLRSTLELTCFHYWWKDRLLGANSYEEFYDWLLSGKKGPTFSDVIHDLYASADLPAGAVGESQFRQIYAGLCSYAHKPLLAEAITTIRGGNEPAATPAVTLYWLRSLHAVQRGLLEVAISQTPHALFPLPLERKFGFNPPVGVFFDAANFVPLREALGAQAAEAYQAHYRSREPPREQLEWFAAQPDLDDEQIMATWSKARDMPDDRDSPFAERVFKRYSSLKAEMRALMWSFAYGQDVPDVQELGRRARSGGGP